MVFLKPHSSFPPPIPHLGASTHYRPSSTLLVSSLNKFSAIPHATNIRNDGGVPQFSTLAPQTTVFHQTPPIPVQHHGYLVEQQVLLFATNDLSNLRTVGKQTTMIQCNDQNFTVGSYHGGASTHATVPLAKRYMEHRSTEDFSPKTEAQRCHQPSTMEPSVRSLPPSP